MTRPQDFIFIFELATDKKKKMDVVLKDCVTSVPLTLKNYGWFCRQLVHCGLKLPVQISSPVFKLTVLFCIL
jgi:hypothetical protein